MLQRHDKTARPIRRARRPPMRDNWDSIIMSHIGGQYFPDISRARPASNVLISVPVRAMSDARRAVTTGFAASNVRLAVHPGLVALQGSYPSLLFFLTDPRDESHWLLSFTSAVCTITVQPSSRVMLRFSALTFAMATAIAAIDRGDTSRTVPRPRHSPVGIAVP